MQLRAVMMIFAVFAVMALGDTASAFAEECPNAVLRTGPSAGLPDCRAYERVSPAEKDGGSGGVLNFDWLGQATSGQPVQSGHPMQSTPDGSAITYTGEPFFNVISKGEGAAENEDASKFWEEYTSKRSSDGWSTVNGDTLPAEEAPVPVLPPSAEETPRATVLEETPSGSKVFFLDEKHEPGITPESTAAEGKPDLYEYDVQTKTTTDLTIDETSGEHAEVAGVIGVGGEGGEEGAYVYFVAGGKLAPDAIKAGDNLYLRHDGATTFIATLSPLDETFGNRQFLGGLVGVLDVVDWEISPNERTSEVSPNGRYVAFPSHVALTSAINESYEIYLYDARAAEDHEQAIVCVSCGPTGAAVPQAILPSSPRTLINGANRQRSVLSDGRVFFTTTASLVPQDVNHQGDVYEWVDGAPHLISGGTSETSFAVFTDASTSGSDVFFTTGQSLVPQDQDESTDLYDAREDGGQPPPSQPECPTSTQCAVAAITPPTLATPVNTAPSATEGAPSHITIKSPTKPPLTRQQRLTKALKACHAKRSRKLRAGCEKSARERYGRRAPTKHGKKR
jgi:hypothetical protein